MPRACARQPHVVWFLCTRSRFGPWNAPVPCNSPRRTRSYRVRGFMFDRQVDRNAITAALGRSVVVLLTGPRQVGKTTLARTYLDPGALDYLDLEDPADLARLSEPMTALSGLKGLVVIDEIQRSPELFPVLRVLADRQPSPANS